MMFEYKLIELPIETKNLGITKIVDPDQHSELLNEQGRDGWELVSVSSFNDASFGTVKLFAYLKRAIG